MIAIMLFCEMLLCRPCPREGPCQAVSCVAQLKTAVCPVLITAFVGWQAIFTCQCVTAVKTAIQRLFMWSTKLVSTMIYAESEIAVLSGQCPSVPPPAPNPDPFYSYAAYLPPHQNLRHQLQQHYDGCERLSGGTCGFSKPASRCTLYTWNNTTEQ